MKKYVILFVLGMLLFTGCTTQEPFEPPQLEEFVSEDGSFSIMLPGKPEFETQTVDTELGDINYYSYSIEVGGVGYVASYSDYPEEFIEASAAEQLLDGARDGSIVGGTLTNEEIISINGYPGREFTVSFREGIFRTRLYLVNNRLYNIFVRIPKNRMKDVTGTDVLSSFKLLE